LPALDVSNVKEFAGLGLEALFDESSPRAEEWSGVLRLGSRSFCGVNSLLTDGNLNDSNLNNSDLNGADMTLGRVHLADSQGWLASFELTESLRRDAGDAVAALQARGLAVYLLSGDSSTATSRVAGHLGIQNAQGDCLPQSKLAFMQALQAQGHKVLMVGDGLNDGPTLAAADVSVAVGAAVPLAQAQSDLVLPGAQLSMLPVLLDQSRRTLKIVKQNLAWAAIYNAIGVPLAVGGFLPAWLAGLGMALSSLLVVLNAARLSRFKTDV
jgi:Cu2+-exporting ATPase